MRMPFLVIVACSAMILGGLALAGVSPGIGTGIAVAGLVLLVGFLIYVYIRAWREGQGDYLTPGDGYRETHGRKAAKGRKR